MTEESEINSPFAAHAEGHEGNAEDEEDDEGYNAHLWGCEPARHANHSNWSHFPLSASVKKQWKLSMSNKSICSWPQGPTCESL